jgi:hypothetical protein
LLVTPDANGERWENVRSDGGNDCRIEAGESLKTLRGICALKNDFAQVLEDRTRTCGVEPTGQTTQPSFWNLVTHGCAPGLERGLVGVNKAL